MGVPRGPGRVTGNRSIRCRRSPLRFYVSLQAAALRPNACLLSTCSVIDAARARGKATLNPLMLNPSNAKATFVHLSKKMH